MEEVALMLLTLMIVLVYWVILVITVKPILMIVFLIDVKMEETALMGQSSTHILVVVHQVTQE